LAIVTVSKAAATARAAEPQILQGPIVTAGIHDRLQVRRLLLAALSLVLRKGYAPAGQVYRIDVCSGEL